MYLNVFGVMTLTKFQFPCHMFAFFLFVNRCCDFTCNNSSAQVDVYDAGGKGGQNHSQRGEEPSNHHHRSAAKPVYQYTAQRAWAKHN